MRRALLAAALVLLAAAAPAPPPRPPGPVGFDHLFHEGRVSARGADPPSCTSCHAVDGKGAPRPPGHAACFGAGCHAQPAADAPDTPEGARGVCLACHDSLRPGKKARFQDAGEASRDYGLVFPHVRHAAAECTGCHAPPTSKPAAKTAGKKARPPGTHARCTGCHVTGAGAGAATATGATFALAACDRCHDLLGGRFVKPSLAPGAYAVGARFSHDSHLARGERCLPCHAAITTVAGRELPAPAMTACEACHDGKAAFAALTPTCTRCHAPATGLPSQAPVALFDHSRHATRGLGDCAACHALDGAGAPRPAAADHMPCATAGCHADEFRAASPRICSGCHVGSEPWRPLRADVPRRRRSEFGVEYAHARHLGGAAPRSTQPCDACHTGLSGGPSMRLGPGHAACAGAGCHAAPGAKPAGAPPSLERCDACHVAGLLPARDRRRAAERWSVAARFDHAAHARDRLDRPIPCGDCHTDVLAAAYVVEIRPPEKAACAGCHDGVVAFKMTGASCSRCHATP